MNTPLREQISKSRMIYQDPYAHLDDDALGGYSAKLNDTEESLEDRISRSRKLLQNPYAYLDGQDRFSALLPTSNIIKAERFSLNPEIIRTKSIRKRNNVKDIRVTNDEIERVARTMQIEMWNNRSKIWATNSPTDRLGVLDASMALKVLGYRVGVDESLGQYSENGRVIEVAGIIDSATKEVRISRQFPPQIRNFTSAHELGHALLHNARGLHRDRPLDGSNNTPRDTNEAQADKFASFFLMPSKLVKLHFEEMYLSNEFSLTPETIFALNLANESSLRSKPRSLRDYPVS